jgi:hypothetical protein
MGARSELIPRPRSRVALRAAHIGLGALIVRPRRNISHAARCRLWYVLSATRAGVSNPWKRSTPLLGSELERRLIVELRPTPE